MRQGITLIDRFIGLLDGGPGKKRRATREWFELTDEEREKLAPELTGRGYPIPMRAKKKQSTGKKIPPLTEDESQSLAEMMWEVRSMDPTLTFQELVGRTQEALPKEKRRKQVVAKHYPRVIEILKKIDGDHSRRATMETGKSKEEVLESLSDQDMQSLVPRVMPMIDIEAVIQSHPANQLLEYVPLPSIVTYLVMKGLDNWNDGQVKAGMMLKSAVSSLQVLAEKGEAKPQGTIAQHAALPKIMVVGLLPDQQNIVYGAVGKKASLTFIDKNRATNIFTNNQNVVILMANFIDHGLQNHIKSRITNGTSMVIHHGGVSKLIERIQGLV